ncbi:hypothetical protein Esti_004321 [Eimeria stiedai]
MPTPEECVRRFAASLSPTTLQQQQQQQDWHELACILSAAAAAAPKHGVSPLLCLLADAACRRRDAPQQQQQQPQQQQLQQQPQQQLQQQRWDALGYEGQCLAAWVLEGAPQLQHETRGRMRCLGRLEKQQEQQQRAERAAAAPPTLQPLYPPARCQQQQQQRLAMEERLDAAGAGFATAMHELKRRRMRGIPEAEKAAECVQASNSKTPMQQQNPKSAEGGPAADPVEEYAAMLGGDIHPEIVRSSDIAGLDKIKKLLRDKIINPVLRPDLHVGLHRAPRGILLFGPPGTGKTTLAKWMAFESGARFFEVTPSSVISKFHGETEKLVKTLFKVAELESPSLIFIDEIDSLLGKRRESQDDASIRMKNQLLQMMVSPQGLLLLLLLLHAPWMHVLVLVQDGLSSNTKATIIVVGATNRPDMLDEAAVRRLSRRVLVPLPDAETRAEIIRKVLDSQTPGGCQLQARDLSFLADHLEGWSGSDIRSLCASGNSSPPFFLSLVSLLLFVCLSSSLSAFGVKVFLLLLRLSQHLGVQCFSLVFGKCQWPSSLCLLR